MVMPARAADAQGYRCATAAGGEAVRRLNGNRSHRSVRMAAEAIAQLNQFSCS